MLPVQHWTPRRSKSRWRSGHEPYNNAYPLFYCPQEYGKGVKCSRSVVEFQARKTVPGGECVRRLASNGCVLEPYGPGTPVPVPCFPRPTTTLHLD